MDTRPDDRRAGVDGPAPAPDRATGLALAHLERWAGAPRHGPHACDPGVPVLAYLAATAGGREGAATAARAVAVWAGTAGRGPGHPGLYDGGLAGTFTGLRLGARLHPALDRAAGRLRDHLAGAASGLRRTDVAFPDYDLITGPAGILLALCAGGDGPDHGRFQGHAEHVTALCDHDDLPRLRTGQYADHPHLSWTNGRVNTGMGHGVAGVVAALTAAFRRTGDPGTARALRRATDWLAARSRTDPRGIRTWPAAAPDGAPSPAVAAPRHAWCYGTPGIAWALWDAADALGDRHTAGLAREAFGTLAERYDEDVHLFGDTPGDLLGLCHGAAGVLAVADAFARHARMPAAAALRDRLAAHLEGRLPDALRTAWPSGLLTGPEGALSALLTARGADRDWLPCLGLR
ncbi:subtilin biosynthesis protein spaC [Streptomyces sp. WAC05374]|uniref:lanthionine synthetase LanC family protein n=1 Tax=Streptomyces sp. WAC05374 TaxID=2487420 RepID=UPI000F880E64|nr:lanthionine synthetase LanC family protein [Streptomyces sp. WAC05374]RST13627.1 subtilin biosynthesis protein spaC [Streptomyces sp. WAC05374]TDF50495.1 subtilin biosynthesis protein spaC [Streptomyces sp. WAC05374]TDF51863.1 subtilin biosynthesis protein spaC [Streptomyces sp. WAC05374]TDF60749.1 subtilin biosynthesis protein spaC [Streptomyces sp. WAC05374]